MKKASNDFCILLVEDDTSFAKSLIKVLESEGYAVKWSEGVSEALKEVEESHFDMVITDFRLEAGEDGLVLIQKIKSSRPDLPIILMTAFGSAETAIDAIGSGAFDYLTKPVDMEELLAVVSRACSSDVEEGVDGVIDTFESNLVRNSRAMQGVFKDIGSYAKNDVPVLIRGETGTGKEVVANLLHRHSARNNNSFVVVNCAAIPEALIESELFGFEKGAFTGATDRKDGYFKMADKGTIFLDEIGELPLVTQVKLLRVLQDKVIQPLGAKSPLSLDIRIIAATNRDLLAAIKEGEFREDFYYRLNAAEILLPPLRERREDISSLVQYFLEKHGEEIGVEHPGIKSEAMNYLVAQAWPGNVRQLENFVRKLLVRSKGFSITLEAVESCFAEDSILSKQGGGALTDLVSDCLEKAKEDGEGDAYARVMAVVEKELITQALSLNAYNQSQVSKLLGISRLTLRNKIKEYKIQI